MRVAVLGGGSWGTTVASIIADNTECALWCRDEQLAKQITENHCNSRYLEGKSLSSKLHASSDMNAVVQNAQLIVAAVPTHAMRTVLSKCVGKISADVPIISLSKGIEAQTHMRMTQVINDVLANNPVGVLTGPNLAKEVLDGHGTATVLAMSDLALARRLQPLFGGRNFRVYTNDDVVGAELGGALKNVIALATGISDGLGGGDNSRAAVMTRGLAELTRLGVALGGRPETFAGLAGMGDLIATCVSPQSRNRFVGEQLGRGVSLEEIISGMDQIAEGVRTVPVVVETAADVGVEVPIAGAVDAVIRGELSPKQAYLRLLQRELRAE